MVFISMWLERVVNKYFAVYYCAHALEIENLAETNFFENFGRAKQILSVQCVRTLRLTEILETCPWVFCLPNSCINENGGETQLKYWAVKLRTDFALMNIPDSQIRGKVFLLQFDWFDFKQWLWYDWSIACTDKGKGMWFERKQPFVGRSVAWGA